MLLGSVSFTAWSMSMLGALLAACSSSWLLAWIGLELNFISFLASINSKKKGTFSYEGSMKYFIVQALGSQLLVFAIFWGSSEGMLGVGVMILALTLKAGVFPFHSWFISVVENFNWILSLLLMTLQKLGPMALLSLTCFKLNFIFFAITILTCLVGCLGGVNQTQIRKLMAYSSLSHMSWVMSSFFTVDANWVKYFFMYSLLTSSVVIYLKTKNIYSFKELSNLKGNFFLMSFMISFLSMGGLPPFMGFFPKLVVLSSLLSHGYPFLAFFLLLLSLVSLFYYVRMGWTLLLGGDSVWKKNEESSSFFIISGFGYMLPALFFFLTGCYCCMECLKESGWDNYAKGDYATGSGGGSMSSVSPP